MNNYQDELNALTAQYKSYNVLLPVASSAQIDPLYQLAVDTVAVDVSENSAEIFKVGQAKVNGHYIDQFALAKPVLYRLAQAAGISFDAKETYGVQVDKYTYKAKATGTITLPTGGERAMTDEKQINLQDEEERFRMEGTEKARNGIVDARQIEDAAKLFKGTYFDTVNKWGKQAKGFRIAPEDEEKYINHYVQVNMALLRKTWAEKAMTGAKLRVIRALLGMKGTYTLDELKRGFAIPHVVFSPDYKDPMVKQMALLKAMGGLQYMFPNAPAIPVVQASEAGPAPALPDRQWAEEPSPEVAGESGYEPADDYYRPDEPLREEDPGPAPMPTFNQPAREPEPVPAEMPRAQARQQAYAQCTVCGNPITKAEYDFSTRRFGQAACRGCQSRLSPMGGGRR